jgi:hypothetical protein
LCSFDLNEFEKIKIPREEALEEGGLLVMEEGGGAKGDTDIKEVPYTR